MSTRKQKIVDCHVNIWEEEHVLPLYSKQLSRTRTGELKERADAETLFEEMAGVDKAIIFSLRYGDSVGIESNDELTAAAVRKYSEKFVGFAYVDPRRPDCLDLLKHAIEDLGLVGVKYGPIYNGVHLSDPRLQPIYSYCEKNDIPITLHMGTTYARQAPIDLGRPLHVEPVALQYPDLKICMAHMGHPWFEECIVVVRKQPNVFAEISALFYRPWQFYNMLIACQEYKITDKIFFGTDYPFAGVAESIEGLGSVNHLVVGTKLPVVAQETIDLILYSDPFDNWWHTNPLQVPET